MSYLATLQNGKSTSLKPPESVRSAGLNAAALCGDFDVPKRQLVWGVAGLAGFALLVVALLWSVAGPPAVAQSSGTAEAQRAVPQSEAQVQLSFAPVVKSVIPAV